MILNSTQSGRHVLALSRRFGLHFGYYPGEAAQRYIAKLAPLNAEKVGTSASGTADLRWPMAS